MDRHVNFLGRYLFNIKASGPGQGLRPLRDPDAVEGDADRRPVFLRLCSVETRQG
ncbi:hypothetical protein ACFT8W_05935 [Streptomyces hygroscopicus]|uniref:hypothetical protein n=1 Tax=Streptomyces hygroscopicus TaxID=1912 RepID=UPI0036376E75